MRTPNSCLCIEDVLQYGRVKSSTTLALCAQRLCATPEHLLAALRPLSKLLFAFTPKKEPEIGLCPQSHKC